MVIERIVPLSLAKVMGAIYAVIGFVAGAMFTLFALMGAAAGAASEPEMAWMAPLFGIAAIVIFPILYGVIAFVMGLVVSGLYNLIAGRIGGVEVSLSGAAPGG
ncbi:MAG TPA: hypothetical protein VFP76_03245 [Gemmatimonadota bacterium]|nr:hypothetical protein [Gemmatimonadota bacterium]